MSVQPVQYTVGYNVPLGGGGRPEYYSTVRRGSEVQVQEANVCQTCCNLFSALVWVVVCSIILGITREAACDTNLDIFIWGFLALNIVFSIVTGATFCVGTDDVKCKAALTTISGIAGLFSLVWLCLGTAWYSQTGECHEHLVNLSLAVLILGWIGIVISFCLVFCMLIAMSLKKRQEQEQQEEHRRLSNPYAVASQV
ncbi:unnamed protein product [Vitrella brassicaformis CCMP3155]|uniref:Uncharacterized protein n=2 Tax=Vitrella brassicaformis TaxID=1169539 RepID=A0A0G4H3M6_VITBC|nr:unnamed protein product [Vitrella brassicaformis CCMP3155]|eukprot:CEM38225.1 unnamed protein product [Vitrella brassicaformis CCMP3155]